MAQMSEQDFVAQLRALYAEPASFVDAPDFARRTQRRLRNRRKIRVAVLGTSGAVAGVVSVRALIASDMLGLLGRAFDPLLKAGGGFGIYWVVLGVLLLLTLALAANLDDRCREWDGTGLE
jgi:hypothetical protein